MDKESFGKKVYEAFEKALVSYTQKTIAEQAGIRPGTLRMFKMNGTMRPENLDRLNDWLIEHGFYEMDKKTLSVEDVLTLLRDFIGIAEMGIPEEQFWRLLRLNVEALMREMPPQKK
jgi:hypothetical protein